MILWVDFYQVLAFFSIGEKICMYVEVCAHCNKQGILNVQMILTLSIWLAEERTQGWKSSPQWLQGYLNINSITTFAATLLRFFFSFFFLMFAPHTHPQHVPRLQIVVWNVPQLLPLNSICLSIVWEWYKQLPFSVAHKQDPFSFIFFLLNVLCDVLLKSCKLLWKMNLHHIFAPNKKGKWSAMLFSSTLQHRHVLTAITSIASFWARKRERKRERKERWMKKKRCCHFKGILEAKPSQWLQQSPGITRCLPRVLFAYHIQGMVLLFYCF